MPYQSIRFGRAPGRADRDINWRASKEAFCEVGQPKHLNSSSSVVKEKIYNSSFPDDQQFPTDNHNTRRLWRKGLHNKWHTVICEKTLNSSPMSASHKRPLYWQSTRTSPTTGNWCSYAPEVWRTSSDYLDFTHTSFQEYPGRWRDGSGIDCRRYVPILGRGY